LVHDVGISAFGRALNVLICAYKIAKRNRGDFYAEHGLACHIETTVDGRSHALLFDFGHFSGGPVQNIDALKIDFDKLEALALSHGIRTTAEPFLKSSRRAGKRYRPEFLYTWERTPFTRGAQANGWPASSQNGGHRVAGIGEDRRD
jgi:hypothetical protein